MHFLHKTLHTTTSGWQGNVVTATSSVMKPVQTLINIMHQVFPSAMNADKLLDIWTDDELGIIMKNLYSLLWR